MTEKPLTIKDIHDLAHLAHVQSQAALGEALFASKVAFELCVLLKTSGKIPEQEIFEAMDRITLILEEKRQSCPTGEFSVPDYALRNLDQLLDKLRPNEKKP